MNAHTLATPRWIDRPTNQGLLLGLLGVTIFALTLPMTRLAVGTVDDPIAGALLFIVNRA